MASPFLGAIQALDPTRRFEPPESAPLGGIDARDPSAIDALEERLAVAPAPKGNGSPPAGGAIDARDPNAIDALEARLRQPAPEEQGLSVTQGLTKGAYQTGGGIAGGVEALAEAIPGGDAIARLMGGARKSADAADQAVGQQFGFTDIRKGSVVPDFLHAIKDTFTTQFPQIATSAAGAVAGGALGSFIPVLGTTAGAILGGAIPNMLGEIGQVQQGIKEVDPNMQAPGAAIAGGTVAGLLDTVLPLKVGGAILSRMGVTGVSKLGTYLLGRFGEQAGEEVAQSVAKKLAQGVALGMSTEAATEAAQQVIEEYAAALGTGTEVKPGLALRSLEAGAMGATLGGPFGAVEGLARKPQETKALPGPDTPPRKPVEAQKPVPLDDADTFAKKVAVEQAKRGEGPPGYELLFDGLGEPKEWGHPQTGDVLPLSPRETGVKNVAPGVQKSAAKPAKIEESVQPVPGVPAAKSNGPVLPEVPGGVPEEMAGGRGQAPSQAIEEAQGTGVTPAQSAAPSNEPAKPVRPTTAPAGSAEEGAILNQIAKTNAGLDAFKRGVDEIVGDGTRAAPIKVTAPNHVEAANTAPLNENPTKGQTDAGNYKKAHIIFGVGKLPITIENRKGDTRKSKDPKNPWEVKMSRAAYGYIKGTEDNTGEQADVYVGDNPQSDKVWVIDQKDWKTGEFDEPKSFVGFDTGQQVLDTYRDAFSDGKGRERMMSIRTMGMDEFKAGWERGEFNKPKVVGERALVGTGLRTPQGDVNSPSPQPITQEADNRSAMRRGLEKIGTHRVEDADYSIQSLQRPGKPDAYYVRRTKAGIRTELGGALHQTGGWSRDKAIDEAVDDAYGVMQPRKPLIPADGADAQNSPESEVGKTAPKNEPVVLKTGDERLAQSIKKHLDDNGPAMGQAPFIRMANEAFGGTAGEGKYDPRRAYDAMETGINLHIAAKPADFTPIDDVNDAKTAVQRLQKIEETLPIQSRRTGDTDAFQQFSTPPSYAYAVNWAASVSPSDTVLEPSAGNGNLAVFAKNAGAKVITNEIGEVRHNNLKSQGFTVHKEDAEQINNILPKDVRPTVVVMNPPFSASGVRNVTKDSNITGRHIDQALARLEPGGRLVAIVGENFTGSNARNAPYFQKWAQQHRISANVKVSGKVYHRYGTDYPTRVLVIDKVPPVPTTSPDYDKAVYGEANSVYDLIDLLKGVRDARPEIAVGEHGVREPAVQEGAGKSGGERVPVEPVRPPTDAVGPGKSGLGTGEQSPSGGTARTPVERQPEKGGGVAVSGWGGTEPESKPADASGEQRGEPSGKPPVGGEQILPAAERGGDELKPKVGAVHLEDRQNEEVQDLSGGVYSVYKPQRLKIEGAKAHPSDLVQSAAMASVQPPPVTYTPDLPEAVIKDGLLSEAQLEAVVYAGQAHSEMLGDVRRGFFVGDGTGLGKGREVAGIILDNMRYGRKRHVWLSEKWPLINDARRDWTAIGGDEAALFSMKGVNPKNDIPNRDGILFLTYDTLKQSPKKQGHKPRIQQIVEWLGKDFDGVIAFDEAHNMANIDSRKGARGNLDPSQKALAGVDLQKALPNARIVYVSATGATEVANLGYAERLGLWGEGTAFANKDKFLSEIESGGVGAMEVVARDMKQMGAYISRSLSFNGVEYDRLEHTLSDEQRAMYDRFVDAWRVVLQNFNKALEATGASGDRQAKATAMSAFWGAHQRFFNQILTTMQMPAVIASVKRDLEEGFAPVFQLVNTNEASQERALAKMEEGDSLEDLDITPRDGLMQLVEHSFPVAEMEAYVDENGAERTRPVVDAAGNPVNNAEAIAMREKLLADLADIRVPDGPLEMILNTFGVDNVAEVTGRSRRVVERNGKRVEESRPASANTSEADAFMSGKKKMLIFSMAGGTGRSYHADLLAKNQNRRRHYLLQPGWSAGPAVQGFGRTHRSNQIVPPFYFLVTTDIKGQKRFISSVARRLDQLGALTKGERKTGSQGLFTAKDNLESKYAKDAVLRLIFDAYNQNEDLARSGITLATFQEDMGLNGLINPDTGALNVGRLPPITQFLNRLLSLKIDQQNAMFEAFDERMEQNIEAARVNGTLDIGVEELRADKIDLKIEKTVHRNEKTGAETKYVVIDTQTKTHPAPWEHIDPSVKENRVEFVARQRRSGRTYAFVKSRGKTNPDGSVGIAYRRVGPITEIMVKESEALDEESYEKLEGNKAKTAWENELSKVPEYVHKTQHMITGALLQVWDRLPSGHAKIYVAKTTDGKRFLGRVVDDDQLDDVLKRLGAERQKQVYTAEDLFTRVLDDNATVTLANGWRLARRRVANEDRLRLFGPGWNERESLVRQGLQYERIGYDSTFFIPNNDNGKKWLENRLKQSPVVSIGTVAGDGAAVYADSPLPFVQSPGQPPGGGNLSANALNYEWEEHLGTGQMPVTPVEMHGKMRSYLVQRGKTTGHESLAVYDPDRYHFPFVTTSNSPDSTRFTMEMTVKMNDPSKRFISQHNHPTNSSLSHGDIGTLALPGHRWVIAHGHDGEWYAASLTPEMRAEAISVNRMMGTHHHMLSALSNLRLSINQSTRGVLWQLINAGEITGEEAAANWGHVANTALSEAGIIAYISSKPISPALQKAVDQVVPAVHAAKDNGALKHVDLSPGPAGSPVYRSWREGNERILGEAGGYGADRGNRGDQERPVGRAQAVRETSEAEIPSVEQTAYHGSPHEFDKFSTEKINTGEGNQTYGYGLYFSGEKKVAEYYREALGTRAMSAFYVDVIVKRHLDNDMLRNLGVERGAVVSMMYRAIYEKDAALISAKRIQWANSKARSVPREAIAGAITELRERAKGKLYHVELAPKDDEWLDWDKPMSEQSSHVRGALEKAGLDVSDKTDLGEFGGEKISGAPQTGGEFYKTLAERQPLSPETARSIPFQSDQKRARRAEASRVLHVAGIPGIRYSDQASRGKDDGTYNYVVFSDKDVSITHVEQDKPFLDGVSSDDQASFIRTASGDLKKIVKEFASGVEPGGHVTVIRKKSVNELPLYKKYAYVAESILRRYAPRIYRVFVKGMGLVRNENNWNQRLKGKYSAIVAKLKPQAFEDFSDLLFKGDAINDTFTREELERGWFEEDGERHWLLGEERAPSQATVTAYLAARKLFEMIGRLVDFHERKMKPALRSRKFALIKALAKMRQMNEPEFRTLVDRALALRSKLRRSEFTSASGETQNDIVRELQAVEAEIYGTLQDQPDLQAGADFAARYIELAGIETRLQNTSVRRIKGYVPHHFIGSWAAYELKREPRIDAITGQQALDENDSPIFDVAYHLIPADQTGFHGDVNEAIRAANAFSDENPSANLVVKPVDFKFANQAGTMLTDKSYWHLVGNIMDAFEIDPKAARDMAGDVARTPGRRKFAAFKQKRMGVAGFSKNINEVFERHTDQVTRYVTMDEFKYALTTAVEAEGLSPQRAMQDRPNLARWVDAWGKDMLGAKQPVEESVDRWIDGHSWSIPTTSLTAGAIAFAAAGGLTGAPLIGALAGSYVGYRFYRSLAMGGNFKTRSVTGAMTGDMAHLKLGAFFNVFSALVNLTQLPLNVYPTLGAKYTGVGLSRYMAAMSVGRNAKNVSPNSRTQAHHDYLLLQRADIKPGHGYADTQRDIFTKQTKLAAGSMFLWNQSEQLNRGAAYLGAYQRASDRGASHGASMREGEAASSRANFIYTNLNKPELLRNILLRVPLQFKNYMAQQIAFVAGLDKKTELPRFLFALTLTAGTLGLPFLDLLDVLWQWLYGEESSPITAMKKKAYDLQINGDLPGSAVDFLLRGAPGLLGFDLSTRAGMGDKFLPLQARDFEGPWFSTLTQARALGEQNATLVDQIKNVTSGLGAPLKALENAANGYPLIETLFSGDVGKLSGAIADGQAVVLNPYLRGRVEYSPTNQENLLTALGGTPLRQAKLRDFGAINKAEVTARNKITRRTVDKATKALERGDSAGFADALKDARDAGVPVTAQQLRNAVREQRMDRGERAIRSDPKSLRPEMQKLYDAIKSKDVSHLEGVSFTRGQAVSALRQSGLPIMASLVESARLPIRGTSDGEGVPA